MSSEQNENMQGVPPQAGPTLDGNPVTETELREAQSNPQKRIREVRPGEYVSLTRMHG